MGTPGSIFFDFNLPNATTWSYFALILSGALFFKFSRLLSMRNLDLLALFLPLPGLLLLLEPDLDSRIGFAWLVAASVLLLLRCLFDLTLVRRPALAPNLSVGGLGWLACALFGSLMAVAVRQPQEEGGDKDDKNPPPLTRRVQDEGESMVQAPNARLWVARTLAVA